MLTVLLVVLRVCRLTYVGRGLKFIIPLIAFPLIVSPHIRGARIEIVMPDLNLQLDEVASHTWGED